MNPTEQEQQRRVLEARARLREGYSTPERVAELVKLVSKKRGELAAQQLVEDMRKQWRCRHEWWDQPKEQGDKARC